MQYQPNRPPQRPEPLQQIVKALVVIIGAVALWASWHAIESYADRLGIFPKGQAFLLPILVDAVVLAAIFTVVAWSRSGFPTWAPWIVAGVGEVASIILNVAHAPPSMAARIVSMAAPLALAAMIWLLELWHRYVRRAEAAQQAAMETQRATREAAMEREREHTRELAEIDRETTAGRVQIMRMQDAARHLEDMPELRGNGHRPKAPELGPPDGTDQAGPSSRQRVQRVALEAWARGDRPTVKELVEQTGVGERMVQRYLLEIRDRARP